MKQSKVIASNNAMVKAQKKALLALQAAWPLGEQALFLAWEKYHGDIYGDLYWNSLRMVWSVCQTYERQPFFRQCFRSLKNGKDSLMNRNEREYKLERSVPVFGWTPSTHYEARFTWCLDEKEPLVMQKLYGGVILRRFISSSLIEAVFLDPNGARVLILDEQWLIDGATSYSVLQN